MADPFTIPRIPTPEALLAEALSGRRRAIRSERYVPPLTEEERASLLGGALSGVAYIGGAIDKPFAATRGLLALPADIARGRTEEARRDIAQLLHLIPFSGTFQPQLEAMGIPVPKEHITGREVLEAYGAPANRPTGIAGWGEDPSEALWDIAGLAVEIFAGPPVLPGALPLTAVGRAVSRGTEMAAITSAKSLANAATMTADALRSIGAKAAFFGPRLAGHTAAGIARELATGERALIGLKAPRWSIWRPILGREPIATFGAGPAAADLFESLAFSGPGRALRAMFSGKAKGIHAPGARYGRAAQMAWLESLDSAAQGAAMVQNLAPSFRMELEGLEAIARPMMEAADFFGDGRGATTFSKLLRLFAEARSTTNKGLSMGADEIRDWIARFGFGGAVPPELAGVLDDVASKTEQLVSSVKNRLEDAVHETARSLGLDIGVLDDIYSRHSYRRTLAAGSRLAGRKGALMNIPEGTVTINRVAQDPLLRPPQEGMTRGDQMRRITAWLNEHYPGWSLAKPKGVSAADLYVFKRYIEPALERTRARGYVPDVQSAPWLAKAQDAEEMYRIEAQRLLKGIEYTADVRRGRRVFRIKRKEPSQAKALRTWVATRPPEETVGAFNRTLNEDWATYMTYYLERIKGALVMHNYLHGLAIPAPEDTRGLVSVAEVWSKLTASGTLEAGIRMPVAKRTAGAKNFLTQDGLRRWVAEFNAMNGTSLSASEIFVPDAVPEMLGRMARFLDPRRPEASAAATIYDELMGLVRAGITTMAPAYHFRNRLQGHLRNVVGETPYSYLDLRRYERQFARWLRGKGDFEYAGELKEVANELLAKSRALDIGVAGEALSSTATRLPEGGLSWIFSPGRVSLNPLRIRGFKEPALGQMPREEARRVAAQPQFVLAAIGDRATAYVEAMNRVPAYAAARKAGLAPSQAIELVKRLQGDYSARNLSPFERNVLKRVFLFYGWMRYNLGYLFSEIMTNPGGREAALIRLAAATGREKGKLPRYLREEMPIILGGPESEMYVARSLGLPLTDLANIQIRGGPVASTIRTLQRFGAQASPLIGLAHRLMYRRDLYTGQDLKAMEGYTGNWALDAFIQATPLSRVASDIRRLAKHAASIAGEERPVAAAAKGSLALLDLLTGVKVSPYDVEKQRLFDLKQAISEELERYPHSRQFSRYYFPAGLRAQVSPRGRYLLEALERVEKERGKYIATHPQI